MDTMSRIANVKITVSMIEWKYRVWILDCMFCINVCLFGGYPCPTDCCWKWWARWRFAHPTGFGNCLRSAETIEKREKKGQAPGFFLFESIQIVQFLGTSADISYKNSLTVLCIRIEPEHIRIIAVAHTRMQDHWIKRGEQFFIA